MKTIYRNGAANLDLPICPKCNDTKNVREESCIPCIAGIDIGYSCETCQIVWYGLKYNREII